MSLFKRDITEEEVIYRKYKDKKIPTPNKEKPLGGMCGVCGTYEDRVLWINPKVCGFCVKRFIKPNIISRSFKSHFVCDMCGRKNIKIRFFYIINPKVCTKCLTKIAKQPGEIKYRQGIWRNYFKKKVIMGEPV